MKSMFYNYEHDIDKKEYPHVHCEPHKKLGNSTEAEFLYNIKGERYGIEVGQTSQFDLYFYLDNINDEDNIAEITEEATFRLEIVGQHNTIMGTFEGELYDYSTVKVPVELTNDTIGYGTYRMRFIMTIEEVDYTLFSENDAVLSVE